MAAANRLSDAGDTGDCAREPVGGDWVDWIHVHPPSATVRRAGGQFTGCASLRRNPPAATLRQRRADLRQTLAAGNAAVRALPARAVFSACTPHRFMAL